MKRREFLLTALAAPAISLPDRITKTQENVPFVINAGIGGNNTVDLLNRIDKDCLTHRPDITILMVGTNDMNSRKHVPLATYRENLSTLVKTIQSSGSQVLLMNILPVYEPYLMTRHPRDFYEPEGHSGRKAKVNEAIRETAQELKIHFLDIHHIFEKVGNIGEAPDSLLQNTANSEKADGVHLPLTAIGPLL